MLFRWSIERLAGRIPARNALHPLALIALLALLPGCGSIARLEDGEYRLSATEIHVSDPSFDDTGLSQYIEQHPKFSLSPTVYDGDLVDASIDNLRDHLAYKGYYHSDVSGDIRLRGKRVKVTYNIIPGKRYRIDSLILDIPKRGQFASDFTDCMDDITIHPGDFLSEESLEAESERGAAYFRTRGYYGFTKNYYFFEADTVSTPGKTILEMSVREYTRNEAESSARPIRKYLMDSVTISYPRSLKLRENVLRGLTTVHPGDTYDESEIQKTYNRLSSLRLFNTVSMELSETDTAAVRCDINLAQSQLQGFKANFETSTNSNGLIGISPQLTFYHKNILGGGEWLNVSFMGNFQFMLSDPTRSDEFGVSASLSIPKFLGLPYNRFHGSSIPRTEFSASYNYQDRPEYTRTIASVSLGYTGSFKKHFSYQLYPLQINMVRLDNMDSAFFETLERNPFMKYAYQDHFDAGAGGMLYYTSDTDANPSRSYYYTRLSLDLSGNILSLLSPRGTGTIFRVPFSQYVRTEVTFGRTWRFGEEDSQALATRLLAGAGYAYGNSSAMPFEKQFYGGGAGSMRGWQARSLGPGFAQMDKTFSIPSQTGDLKLEANIEYRFPLVWKLAGALFVDAGNVWSMRDIDNLTENEPFINSVAADWGIGARVDLSFLILRLDLGMKMHDPSREAGERWLNPGQWLQRDGCAIHFGVGYPF